MNTRKLKLKSDVVNVYDFHKNRNKVLLLRDCGGAGDILMMRMIFEDFKLLFPEVHLTAAVPPYYFPLLQDHPFLDEMVSSKEVNESDYAVVYDITTACMRYEMNMGAECDKHRSDIWAEHCGIILTKHEMYLKSSKKIHFENKTVLFSPLSSQISKDLDKEQINSVVKEVGKLGFNIIISHYKPVECDGEYYSTKTLREWLDLIDSVDYVISVDTGTLHAANGFQKPSIGIFSWANGISYMKYHHKFELVQKHRQLGGLECCPCFNHHKCPYLPVFHARKPCITEITAEMIVNAFKKLVEKY